MLSSISESEMLHTVFVGHKDRLLIEVHGNRQLFSLCRALLVSSTSVQTKRNNYEKRKGSV